MKFFGATLRAYRERAGMTRQELADRIAYAESTVLAFEAGKRVPKADQIPIIDAAIGADGALLVAARQLDEEGKYPEFFLEQASCEAACRSFMSYDSMAIPGLLQTEDYARAALQAGFPRVDDDEVERLLVGRLERQALLTRRPSADLSFVIDEAACRRPIGGVNVLREQLAKVVEYSELRNVAVQLLPLNSPEHNGLDGSAVLLTTDEGKDLGFIEGPTITVCVSLPEQVHTLAQRYGMIRTQALTTQDSIKAIERIAGEL